MSVTEKANPPGMAVKSLITGGVKMSRAGAGGQRSRVRSRAVVIKENFLVIILYFVCEKLTPSNSPL